MSWFPMHAVLVVMIGFKVGYILEKSVPTNLNSGLFFLGFLLNRLYVTLKQSIPAHNSKFYIISV